MIKDSVDSLSANAVYIKLAKTCLTAFHICYGHKAKITHTSTRAYPAGHYKVYVSHTLNVGAKNNRFS